MKKIIISIFVLFICATAFSQQAFTNSGNLQLHAGASISGFGNFTNNSSGVLVNNGSFYLKGNITNNQSSMSAGAGVFYLNGTSAQSVDGAQTFKTYNLQTNNSAGITLNNNLSVSGIHTFSAGLIGTSATPNYLVYEAGSSHTGSNDSRHVTGWVKKFGTTNFTFPVGDASYMRTAGVASLSSNSEINCHYYRPTANSNNITPLLVKVNANEYWQIDKISGGTAQIALNWDNSKVPFDNVLVTEIRVAHYTSSSWTGVGGTASGNPLTTGSVTSAAVSSFSPFTFGYEAYPVPLKLISFTAERKTGVSFLHWITDNEENVDRFDVQRSNDGVIFTTIGNINARNTSFQERYDFEDRSPFQGIMYYRVKPVDIDGKFTYTKIIALTENQFQSNSFVVLNPVRSVITVINKSIFYGLFNYRLLNASGQLILYGDVNMGLNGSAVMPLPAQAAAGVYVLELSNGKIEFRQKILVEK